LGTEFVVRLVVSHLVIVALALHAVLGCCRHHAHDSDVAGVLVEGESTASMHDCRHGSHERELVDHDDEHEHEPVGRHSTEHHSTGHEPDDHAPGSCGDTCQFVAVNRVQFNEVLDAAVPDLLPAEASADAAIVCVALRVSREQAAVDPPPLRLHLLYQLLLI